MSAADAVLRLEDVWKAFGDHDVLQGIDLEVASGEVVALIGASGSGKSTLLRTVNLLEPIDDGRIWLSGADISDPQVDVDAVRARIGVVFQQYNLFPHLTVKDNITLALRHVHRYSKSRADAAATTLLERVGLAAKAGDHPDRLSGGQQQRVAIARAVATSPDLLLLDEITSALDPELVERRPRPGPRARRRRHDDRDGHARDGVRARRRRPRGVPRRRAHPRVGHAGRGLRGAPRGANRAFLSRFLAEPSGPRCQPTRRSAASTTFVMSRATVIGPTPPGFGDSRPATSATSGCTSP